MGWLSSLTQACLPMGGCWQDFICWPIHSIMLYIQIGGSLWYWSSSTFWGLLNCLDLVFEVPLWLAGTNRCWGHCCWDTWSLGARDQGAWYLGPWCWVWGLVPWLDCLGTSFLALAFCSFRREHWGWTCPLRPQWWHIEDLLMEGGFWVPWPSPMILSFPLSSAVGGGSGTTSFTNTVFEIEGTSEEGATYPRPILSVELFWIDSIQVSFSSVTLSNWSWVSSSFSSSSWILSSNELFSVCKLFRSWICCFRPSLSFSYSMYRVL
jgi:hypothetical protein